MRDFRKHTNWYMSGYPVGPEVRAGWRWWLAGRARRHPRRPRPTTEIVEGGERFKRGHTQRPDQGVAARHFLDDRDDSSSPTTTTSWPSRAADADAPTLPSDLCSGCGSRTRPTGRHDRCRVATSADWLALRGAASLPSICRIDGRYRSPSTCHDIDADAGLDGCDDLRQLPSPPTTSPATVRPSTSPATEPIVARRHTTDPARTTLPPVTPPTVTYPPHSVCSAVRAHGRSICRGPHRRCAASRPRSDHHGHHGGHLREPPPTPTSRGTSHATSRSTRPGPTACSRRERCSWSASTAVPAT